MYRNYVDDLTKETVEKFKRKLRSRVVKMYRLHCSIVERKAQAPTDGSQPTGTTPNGEDGVASVSTGTGTFFDEPF